MVATIDSKPPGIAQVLLFEVRAAWFRLRRHFWQFGVKARVAAHRRGLDLQEAKRIVEVRCPLWTNTASADDRALTAGKVHNIRLALTGIDGIVIPAGTIFSFWAQVGRPSRRRGFVDGRELREGCLIASPGGGLCQLSNALYEAALRAGFEIVERHAHSRAVPGSRAALGRDATVFWNYVDLRFRAPHAFRIDARLTHDTLIVAFRAADSRVPGVIAPVRSRDTDAAVAHDCVGCDKTACWHHIPNRPADTEPPRAWLVDATTPEFAALFERLAKPEDALLLPTRRFGAKRYAWPANRCRRESTATLSTLRRSLEMRGAGQGAALQARSLAADARLAADYAARLSYLDTHVVVAQNLLPHLWRLGVLQGRAVSVLMSRLPIDLLQARLDAAAALYPESPTLADFRAPVDVVRAERAALGAARTLYTAHPEIADAFPEKSVRLDWAPVAPLAARRAGKTILLPTSGLARKGAYALREAIAGLDLDLVVAGQAVETQDFWSGLPVRILASGEQPAEIAAVVLPAIVEHQPRALLAALAAGIPVIATPACGLTVQDGLTLVPAMEAVALADALRALGTRNASQG